MDLHEIRRLNMAYLGDLHGREGLASMLGYEDTNYINGVITGHTPLGTRNASRFGEAVGLGGNWLNEPHPDLWAGGDPTTGIPALDSAIDELSAEDADLILRLVQRLSQQS